LKIWAFRIPHFAALILCIATYLFVLGVYHAGGFNTYLENDQLRSAFYTFVVIFLGTPLNFYFPVFVVAFSIFCVSVESQYGMIRILASQPLSRTQYILAKGAAISFHVAQLSLVSLLAQFCCALVYSSQVGITSNRVGRLILFSLGTIFFSLALCWMAMAAALLARTLTGGIIIAFASWIGFFSITLALPESLKHFMFVRYWIFPLVQMVSGEPLTWLKDLPRGLTLLGFLGVVTLSTAMICLPAFCYFRRRDITE